MTKIIKRRILGEDLAIMDRRKEQQLGGNMEMRSLGNSDVKITPILIGT